VSLSSLRGCGHPILGRARWIPAAAPTLTAEQVAETILFAINQPEGVDVSHLVLLSTGQVN